MLVNKNIICVAATSWEAKYLQNVVQLASLLAKNNKVLYVDYAFTWIDLLKAFVKPGSMHKSRILGFKNRVRKVSTEYNTELYILSLPPVLPLNWINSEAVFNGLNKLNYFFTLRAIQKAQQRLGLAAPVYINSWNPVFGLSYKGGMNEVLQVYHCYDEISAAKWVKKHGMRFETAYLPKADIVITTSKELMKTKGLLNQNCYVVPNGVNFDLFHSYLEKKTDHTLIDKTGYKYVVGYIGTIDDRMDTAMMQYAIEKLPDYLFVYIGRVTDTDVKTTLEKYNNVTFIPPMHTSGLPKYLYEFSVCIIPFVTNEFTINVYPVKINEYLAMGKPVVLTNFSDLNEFAPVCQITSSPEAFTNALVVETQTDTDEKRKQRIEIASQNSWEKRTEAFSEILSKALAQKKNN